MKKIILILSLFVSATTMAQQVFVELGRVNSSFDFTDSQGQSLDNLQSESNSYAGIGYKHNLISEKLDVALGINYNSYGATWSDATVNATSEWEVDYIGLNLNFQYNAISIKDFSLFAKAGVSYEFLATGTQRLSNSTTNITVDLVKEGEFDQNAFFFRAGAGVSYPIFKGGSLYAQYLWGQSLPLKDETEGRNSELKITTHMFGLGLVVDILNRDAAKNNKESEED